MQINNNTKMKIVTFMDITPLVLILDPDLRFHLATKSLVSESLFKSDCVSVFSENRV